MNGITRGKVIDICKHKEIPCHQKNFSLFDVYGADEAFVTGSFGGLTPVTKVDGRLISSTVPGKMTSRLQKLYDEVIRNEVNKSMKQ
jgi:branched-chain amino acid aminotransferase